MKRISDIILYKDHHLIIVNKPGGLPAQDDPTGDISAHRMAMAYARRDLHIVHRLDRRVSGVLVFAKTKSAAAHLSKQWEQHTVKKTYLALVPRADIPESGHLVHDLTYDQKNNMTHASEEVTAEGRKAELSYRVLQHLDHFMLLGIDLISGRKHQIRAQLSAIGVPVRGDIKYGSKRTNPNGAIDLHAYRLVFVHPSRGSEQIATAPLPEDGLWDHVDPEVLSITFDRKK